MEFSPEVFKRLKDYEDLLKQWNKAINLVSPGTIQEAWQRHILDSAQLLPLIPSGTQTLADFGTGAGFPGLVLAILGVPQVILIESDQRKSAFLQEAIRVTNTPHACILTRRIETLTSKDMPNGKPVDIVTARALAPLPDLLAYARPILAKTGVCLFLKGSKAEEEIAAARMKWSFNLESIPSQTDPRGVILRIHEVNYAGI